MVGEQLAFELKRGLFGRKQNRAAGRRALFAQRGTDFPQATECLAAAGGAEEKSRLHTGFFAQRRPGAKEFIREMMRLYFLFLFGRILLSSSAAAKSDSKDENLCH